MIDCICAVLDSSESSGRVAGIGDVKTYETNGRSQPVQVNGNKFPRMVD